MNRRRRLTPALLTRPWRAPCCSPTSATTRSQSFASVTSRWWTLAVPPAARISSATGAASATSARATRQPSPARVRACPAPMPPAAPVIRTTRPRGVPSDMTRAAVHGQDVAGHVAGTVGQQEDHRADDLLGRAEPVQRDRVQRLGERLRVVLHPAGHLGVDEARRDRVDADAEVAVLDGEALGE